MSGGRWDYRNSRAYYDLSDVIDSDDFGDLAGGKVATVARQVNGWLYDVTHDLDWHLSGDTKIKDLKQWRADKLAEIKKILESL